MDLDPHVAPRVIERRAVRFAFVGLVADLANVAAAQHAGFDGLPPILRHQQVDVAHRAQVGGRVELVGDGDALEKSDRYAGPGAVIEDLDGRVASIAVGHPSREFGTLQCVAPVAGRSGEGFPRRVKQQGSETRLQCAAELVLRRSDPTRWVTPRGKNLPKRGGRRTRAGWR